MSPPPKPILKNLDPQQTVHVLDCLERYVDRSAGPDACWPWTGGSFVRGYGVVYTSGTVRTRRMVKAHRLAYEVANNGECPPTVDHLCHEHAECDLADTCPHRRCCNPAHLKGETSADNSRRAQQGRRQVTCRAGHRMDPDNTYETPDGGTRCRTCGAAAARAARQGARLVQGYKQRVPKYRPRGLDLGPLVDWALSEQEGDACWYWPGSGPGDNYKEVRFGGKMIGAHRLVHEARLGPIPPGMVVDHACHDPQVCDGGLLCPHRACVNPEHLQAVAPGVNTSVARSRRRRPEACHEGHPFTPENTYVDKRGSRHCVTCRHDRQRKAREEAKGTDWVDGRARQDNLCKNGHDVTVVGVRSSGKCAECARLRSQEHKQRKRAAAAR